jgi:thymidine phosphorylase
MIGQTPQVCPADKKLYALRDVTATVPSQPLIVASIMSKKLAESLDALVLDVKFGRGAFMKTRREAKSLGAAMQSVGQLMGVETHVVLNPMDEPLGRAVGNALEVVESLEVLRGEGPSDLRKIVLDLAEKVSVARREQLESWLDDGSALNKFREMVAAQGGMVSSLDDFPRVHRARTILDVKAEQSGVAAEVDAEIIGRACVQLGAGRSRAEDSIDFSVGFDGLAKKGQTLWQGDIIGRVHARDEASAREAAVALRKAVKIS